MHKKLKIPFIVMFMMTASMTSSLGQKKLIGNLFLENNKVNHYVVVNKSGDDPEMISGNASKDSLEIDTVKIIIKEATIRYILVKTKRGRKLSFKNRQTSISLPRFSNRHGDKLYNDESSSKSDTADYICIGDVLRYQDENTGYFRMDDGEYTLLPRSSDSPAHDIIHLERSSDYGLDIKSYTDAGAFLGEKPNGLATIEATARFLTTVSNYRNFPGYSIQYVDVYGGYTKFDSKAASTSLSEESKIEKIQLFQRAYVTAGLRLSLLKIYSKEDFLFDLTTSAQLSKSNVQPYIGASQADSTTYPVSLYSWITQADISCSAGALFNFKLSPGFIFQGLDYDSRMLNIDNAESYWIFKVTGLISVNTSKESNSDKVFIRINYYKGLENNRGDFTQYQIGYNKSFGDLFKTNSQAEANKKSE